MRSGTRLRMRSRNGPQNESGKKDKEMIRNETQRHWVKLGRELSQRRSNKCDPHSQNVYYMGLIDN